MTQVPKRKPKLIKGPKKEDKEAKPPVRPKKFAPFSESDSRRTEARYQRLLEAVEGKHDALRDSQNRPSKRPKSDKSDTLDDSYRGHTRVPVNEDYLFDLDIEERELAPVYWLGPIYEGWKPVELVVWNICADDCGQYDVALGSSRRARV